MVICSKLYLTLLSPKRGGARRAPTIWDRSRLIDIGPKYLALPTIRKRRPLGAVLRPILSLLRVRVSIGLYADEHAAPLRTNIIA